MSNFSCLNKDHIKLSVSSVTPNKLYVKREYAILASAIAQIQLLYLMLYMLTLYEGRISELTAGQTTQYLSGLPKNTGNFIRGGYQDNDDDYHNYRFSLLCIFDFVKEIVEDLSYNSDGSPVPGIIFGPTLCL